MPRVPADTLCIRCSYDLRGLSDRHKCPECGTAVAATLRVLAERAERGEPLRETLAHEVRSLRHNLLSIGLLLAGVLAVAIHFATRSTGAPSPDYGHTALMWLVDAGGALLGAFAAARFGFLGFGSLTSLLLAIGGANAVTMGTLAWIPSLSLCGGQYVFPVVLLWWLLDVDSADVFQCLGLVVLGRVLARLGYLLVVISIGAA